MKRSEKLTAVAVGVLLLLSTVNVFKMQNLKGQTNDLNHDTKILIAKAKNQKVGTETLKTQAAQVAENLNLDAKALVKAQNQALNSNSSAVLSMEKLVPAKTYSDDYILVDTITPNSKNAHQVTAKIETATDIADSDNPTILVAYYMEGRAIGFAKMAYSPTHRNFVKVSQYYTEWGNDHAMGTKLDTKGANSPD